MNSETARTAIILGASNLTLAWPRIMRQMEQRLAGPRRVLTAHGMGRSYLNQRSAFGFRQLPGILHCDLWNQLGTHNSAGLVPVALITDLGNDLLFGRNAIDVANSALTCIERLRAWCPEIRIAMTCPPVESVNRLGWMRFVSFRTIIFPACRLTLGEIRQQACELSDRVTELADSAGVPLFVPSGRWYGLDPIHIRYRNQFQAFGEMMDLWCVSADADSEKVIFRKHPRPTAQVRWVFGRKRHVQQPVVHLNESAVFAF